MVERGGDVGVVERRGEGRDVRMTSSDMNTGYRP